MQDDRYFRVYFVIGGFKRYQDFYDIPDSNEVETLFRSLHPDAKYLSIESRIVPN